MIVDFSFKNFRSFRDDTLLSLHAEHPKSNLLGNISYPLKEKVGVLKTAVIYGANASGKSNILVALNALKHIVNNSHAFKENKKISCYEPYRLSDCDGNPTELEMEFIIPGLYRFIYQVSYNSTEIISETLDYYPGRTKANIFSRPVGSTWETISFGGHYKGGVKRIPFFKNNSYLSVAGNNAGTPEVIRDVYRYFSQLLILSTGYNIPIGDIYAHDGILELAANFMSKVDVGISNITKKEQDLSRLGTFPADMPKYAQENFLSQNRYRFIFHHADADGRVVEFEKSEESDGTQKLFSILPAILSTLVVGNVLVMDELESSFHPHIAELIIGLFNDPEININHAQLIFTTHNVELMSPSIFRRDQIWFTKKTDGASRLYSLDEFDKSTVKPSSPFGEWYSEGRFGAVPELNYKDLSNYVSQVLWKRKKDSAGKKPLMIEEE